ncbi:MAG TPA: DUF5916 domain-containing protein, partial [Flavisolibacter sp.]|nr:DUF5916 domain-containing protein [Flavisolibacter sp.]
KDTSVNTSFLTNYNLLVLDQALKGRSAITFTNTNVLRNAEGRDANVSSLDLNFFTQNNKYQLELIGQYSKIFGYSPLPALDYSAYGINLINDTIRVNNKLLVKPYSGFKGILYFGKVSGRWQYDLTTRLTSDKFDPNDMGYLQAPNDVVYDASLSYKQLTATDNYISYRYTLGTRYTSMFRPYAFNQYEVYGSAFWLFKNFWDVTLYAGSQPFEAHDYFELRTPNRFLKKPGFSYFSAVGSTDSRKKLFVNYAAGGGRYNMDDGWYYTATLGLRYRFNNRFLLSVSVDRTDVLNEIGYAFLREPNGEPIIGFRRNQQTSTIINGTYTFTSRLNFTVRTRHYWNQVRYNDFYNVATDGSYTKRTFIPNQDENYTLFNVDAFLNWDFRLGSRVTVGYKNWLGNPYAVMNSNTYLENLKSSLTIPHGNELTVKLIY